MALTVTPKPAPEVANPNDLETQNNQKRHFAMRLLHALGLEILLNHRAKNVAEVYVQDGDNSFAADMPVQRKTEEAPQAKPAAVNMLYKLLDAIRQAIRNILNTGNQNVQQRVQAVQANGQITAPIANLTMEVANEVFTEDHLKEAMKKAEEEDPSLTEAEIETVSEDLRDDLREANDYCRETTRSSQSIPADRTQAVYDLLAMYKAAKKADSYAARLERIQARREARRAAMDSYLNHVLPSSSTVVYDAQNQTFQILQRPEFSSAMNAPYGNAFLIAPKFGFTVSSSARKEELEEVSRSVFNLLSRTLN